MQCYNGTGPIEDLIIIVQEFVNRKCFDNPVLGASITLLGRFTLIEGTPKTTEKVWKFLETLLSKLSTKDILESKLVPYACDWMFYSKEVLNPCFIYGRKFDLAEPTRKKLQKKRRKQNFNIWNPEHIIKCYSFYFGESVLPMKTPFELCASILRILTSLAKLSLNSSILESVCNFVSTVQMPVCNADMSYAIDNWFTIINYSVMLGKALVEQVEICERYSNTEFEKCLELTIAHALRNVQKFLSVSDLFEQLLVDPDAYLYLADIKIKSEKLASSLLFAMIGLLSLSIKPEDMLSTMFNSSLEHFLVRSKPKHSISLAIKILRLKHGFKKQQFFHMFSMIISCFGNDRTMWDILLHVLEDVPVSFTSDISPSVLIKLFLLPIDTRNQIYRLKTIFKRHLKDRPWKLHDGAEVAPIWVYLEKWWLLKRDPVIRYHALKIFSYIAPVLPESNFRRCTQVLMSCDFFDKDPTKLYLLNTLLHIFALYLRAGHSFENVFRRIVSTALDDLPTNTSIQDNLFELIKKMLTVGNESQLIALVDVLLERFRVVMHMALTDIWLLLSDSAESSYNALRCFLSTFKLSLCNSKLADRFSRQIAEKLESLMLLKTCADVFQQTTQVNKELNKGAQTIASLMFIDFSTSTTSQVDVVPIVDSIVENVSSNVAFMLIYAMLHECFYQNTIDYQAETWTSSSSDDELSETPCNFQLDNNSYSLVQEQMFALTLKTFNQVLISALMSKQKFDFELTAFCTLLKSRRLPDQQLDKLIVSLFDAATCLNEKGRLSELKCVVDTIGSLLHSNPTSYNIAQLLSFSYVNSGCFESILSSLRRVLESCELKPNFAIRFPQHLTIQQNPSRPLPDIDNEFIEAGAYFALSPVYKIFANQGLTVSFWLNLVERQTSTFLHILSIRTPKFSVSMHANPKKNKIKISVTAINQFMSRSILKNVFGKSNRWINIMFGTVCQEGRIETMVIIDDKLKMISHKADIKCESDTFSIGFGCVSSQSARHLSVYEISTIFGYKGFLDYNFSLTLRAMGCARDSLAECALGQVDYSFLNCLTKSVLFQEPELLFSKLKSSLDKIQKKLLFTINASTPEFYNLSVIQNGAELEKVQNMAMLLTVTEKITITWRCSIDFWSPNSLDRGLRTIGYVKLFVFGYALSCDRNYSAKAQCEALSLLASALKRDPSAHRIFTDMDGASLIARILLAESAHFTRQIYDVLLNLMFSPLGTDNNGTYFASPLTCIVEPKIINALVSSYNLWVDKNFELWVNLLQIINNCLCDSYILDKTRVFNQHQLESTDFLANLLNVLLIIVQSPQNYPNCNLSENEQVQASKASTLPKIINELIGRLLDSTASACRVNEFWNFIRLSHPPADTQIDKEIQGRNNWIQADLMPPTEYLKPKGESELSLFINNLCKRHSKEKIEECMIRTNSIISVRNKFIGIPCFDTASSDSSKDASLPKEEPPERKQAQSPICQDSKDWTIELRYLFMEKLAEVVLIIDDHVWSCIELDVICWQSILALLSNQRHLHTRTAIFKLLMNFFHRCNAECRNSFTLKQGFVILSNELRKYPVNADIANALFSITCGEPVVILNGLDSMHLDLIVYDKFKICSLYALFTLLEESVEDNLTFWAVCSTLQKMFVSENAPRLAFFEMGIVNSMVNVLRRLSLRSGSLNLDSPIFPILDCWISFSRSIISLTVPYKDKKAYIYCQDFVLLCLIADWQNGLQNCATNQQQSSANNQDLDSSDLVKNFDSTSCPSAETPFRRMLFHLLYSHIDSIQTVLTDQPSAANDPRLLEEICTSEEILDFEMLSPDSAWSFESLNKLELRRDAIKEEQRQLAPADELAQRLVFGLQIANDALVFLIPDNKVSDEEDSLFDLHLELLFSTWHKWMDRKLSEWQIVLSLCKKRAIVLLVDLIAYVLFPVQQKRMRLHDGSKTTDTTSYNYNRTLERRVKLVQAISAELPSNRSLLVSILEINLDYQHALKIAVHELALCWSPFNVLITNLDEDLDKLIKFLYSIQIKSPLTSLTNSEIYSLSTDEQLLLDSFYEKEQDFASKLNRKARSLCSKETEFLQIVSDKAESITRELAQIQNSLCKCTLRWNKGRDSTLAKASETLYHLANQLCHPEAVFYDSVSWPRGFALDTTENIKRERRRLKVAHYDFPIKFLQKFKQEEMGNYSSTPLPLERLLEDSLSGSAIERVEANVHIRMSLSVTLIRTTFECTGEIVLSNRKLYFLGESSRSTQKGKYYAPVSYSWTFEQIREIQNRFYLLKDRALELFTTTGEAFLIVFSDGKHRKLLFDHLNNLNLGDLIIDPREQLQTATRIWQYGHITNFDYLMFLNKLAGRTFNDLMQYPVFPFILSDYSSLTLDLNNEQSFRDLARPMPIQDKKMESFYIQTYKTLLEECNNETESGFLHMAPYHFGSHYSNTGIVAHFLVRVLPYTTVALEYQDNNFDIPDRLFSNLEITWRLSSSESTTDFKELIPEFFFFPEMFQNRNGLKLGVRQNGQPVDDVELPLWCPSNNARLFCLIHRQALESANVTKKLHSWIDLIFGYKQQGEEAIKAVNLFHPSTYRGRNLEEKIAGEPIYHNAILTMQRTYGQMPEQLFQQPLAPNAMSHHYPHTRQDNQLLQSVRGLKWGDFVGSPETSDRLSNAPTCAFQLDEYEKVDHLIPLSCNGTMFCYGVPVGVIVIAKYKTDREDILRRNFELDITAAISWVFPDRILRIRQMQSDDALWVNLIELSSFEVTKIAFSPSNDHLYIGFVNGLIHVYLLMFRDQSKPWSISHKSELYGHRSTITSLQISDNFHVALSTCPQHACLWDMNTLGFVRKFTSSGSANVEERLKLSAISTISCDVALVYDSVFGSRVSLYTVNGDLIGTYTDNNIITSLAMTNLDEGTGINCLALGTENGMIRLLEVWTMTTIRIISCSRYNDPVVSLLFVNNSNLFAAYASPTLNRNSVLCWTSSVRRTQNISFQMLNPFL